jgi:hypothetical protein
MRAGSAADVPSPLRNDAEQLRRRADHSIDRPSIR